MIESGHSALTTFIFAIFFGVLLSILAKRARIPAIVPLLIGGVVLGPELLGWITPASLGNGLTHVISLCVAIILFEGGLTLERGGFQRTRDVLTRLLTVGVLTTWLGTAIAIYYLFGLPVDISLLAGSLIIVTGPTVVTPLLNRIRVRDNLHQILHWEGVLIDPIGVFIAVLVFEWLSIDGTAATHLGQFALRLLVGIGFGFGGGQVILLFLRRKWIPEEQINIAVFSGALLLFGVSELIVHEAGILTAVIAGLVIGWKQPTELKHIVQFKSELTEISISILFILLAANLELHKFLDLGQQGLLLIAVVILLIRPLGAALSTLGSNLDLCERLFLAWTAPRGVVAGSMAALFALELGRKGSAHASFLEAFTFSIIGSTVIFQGLLSNLVAKLLKVKAPPRRGWLIVGAHTLGQGFARILNKKSDAAVILLDTNVDTVDDARQNGLTAVTGNAIDSDSISDEWMRTIGNVLTLTDNRDLNQLICGRWREHLTGDHLFYWTSSPDVSDAERRKTGNPVWFDLPKPSVVTNDLVRGQSQLLFQAAPELPKFGRSETVLATKIGPDIIPGQQPTDTDTEVVICRQTSAKLPLWIHHDHIIDLVADSFEHAITHAIDLAVATYPELPKDLILKTLLNRQLEFPVLLGNGIALPHVHIPDIEDPVCMLLRLTNPEDSPVFEDEPLNLIFIVISPDANPHAHINLLADIAKIANHEKTMSRILSAENVDEIRKLLSETNVL